MQCIMFHVGPLYSALYNIMKFAQRLFLDSPPSSIDLQLNFQIIMLNEIAIDWVIVILNTTL